MATPDLLKQIQDLGEEPQKATPDQLQNVMKDAALFFDDIKSKLSSKDPEEQKAAQKTLTDLKGALEQQAQLLCQAFGVDPSLIDSFLKSPENLHPDESEVFEMAKKEYELRKEQLSPRPLKKTQKLIFS